MGDAGKDLAQGISAPNAVGSPALPARILPLAATTACPQTCLRLVPAGHEVCSPFSMAGFYVTFQAGRLAANPTLAFSESLGLPPASRSAATLDMVAQGGSDDFGLAAALVDADARLTCRYHRQGRARGDARRRRCLLALNLHVPAAPRSSCVAELHSPACNPRSTRRSGS